MQRLTQSYAYLLLLALLLAGAGCGGGNSASSSRFAGTYSGTFLYAAYIQPTTSYTAGTVNLTIDPQGNVTGTTANSVGTGTGTLTGAVSRTGTATLNFVSSDSTHDTASGTVMFNGSGNLLAPLTNSAGNSVTLMVTTSGHTLPYPGTYFGSLAAPGSISSPTLSVTISTAGVLTGTAINGGTTTLAGTVSRLGVTSLTATTPSGTSTSLGGSGFEGGLNNIVFELVSSSGTTTILTLNRPASDPDIP